MIPEIIKGSTWGQRPKYDYVLRKGGILSPVMPSVYQSDDTFCVLCHVYRSPHSCHRCRRYFGVFHGGLFFGRSFCKPLYGLSSPWYYLILLIQCSPNKKNRRNESFSSRDGYGVKLLVGSFMTSISCLYSNLGERASDMFSAAQVLLLFVALLVYLR